MLTAQKYLGIFDMYEKKEQEIALKQKDQGKMIKVN
jgi:hypothetical protein